MDRPLLRSWIGLLASVLIVSGAFALRAARTEPISRWEPDRWYRLQESGGIAACRLSDSIGDRFWLVIGCLGDSSETHTARWRWTSTTDLKTASQQRIALRDESLQSLPSHHDDIASDRPTMGPSSPPTVNTIGSPDGQTSSSDVFVHVTDGDLNDPRQYVRVRTQVVAVGARIQLLLDQQMTPDQLPHGLLEELVCLLDSDVMPTIEHQFGSLVDVNRDGRLAVVLTPWLSRLQGGRTSIRGMVRSSDFQPQVVPPLGNQRDMLLLNTDLPRGDALRDLLFHEVAHAACISQRLRVMGDSFVDDEDWLNEALAHWAEPGWSNRAERLATFLESPEQSPLVVSDYYRAGLWRDPGCRGATFLFAQWCVDQHGTELPRRLAESSAQGIANFEQATSRRFEDLFRDWSLAVANNHVPSVDLFTSVGQHRPNGIRQRQSVNESGEQTCSLRGTSFAVIEFQIENAENLTLNLIGDSSALWQYSICRIGRGTFTPAISRRP